MKKILFDFLTFQDRILNGGYLYARTVLLGLLEKGCEVLGICEKEELLNDDIKKIVKENKIKVFLGIDDIEKIVKEEKIDAFFIGIAQRYKNIDVSKVSCKIYIVCHDVWDICLLNAGLSNMPEVDNAMMKLDGKGKRKLRLVKNVFKRIISKKRLLDVELKSSILIKEQGYQLLNELFKKDNVEVLTVSEYSKSAIEYYFDQVKNEVKVFACPKITRMKGEVSQTIKDQVANKKYFLLLSVNRYNKNVSVFLRQFDKFNKENGGEFSAILLGTGYKNQDEKIIGIPRVSDSEMGYLMDNAYALIYPSLVEGFGLPPVEAMEFGTPVIASFNTSIPEVCGDGALYFNPVYPEDLYSKCKYLVSNYDERVKKAKTHYIKITQKMQNDLERLLIYLSEK